MCCSGSSRCGSLGKESHELLRLVNELSGPGWITRGGGEGGPARCRDKVFDPGAQ